MATTVSAPASLGRFVWLELVTPDPDAATAFYTTLVGWTTTAAPGPMPYTMWNAARGSVGGVMALGPELKARGVPPHWHAYVSTPDCDATLKQVAELGGTVRMPAADIPNVGRFGVFMDPQGAVMALLAPIQGGDTPDRPGAPEKGEIVWHELGTTDHVAAFDFYHALFAWNKTDAMEMGPGNVYQMFGRGQQTLGGMYNVDQKLNQSPSWLHYIEVEDVARAADQIPQLGGKILNGPMDVPGGRIVMAIDPQGAAFALHTAKRS